MYYLSIIIPVYNEEKRLPIALEKILKHCQSQPYLTQVIIVENGSSDKTYEIASNFAASHDHFYVIKEDRRGKGLAVQRGMLESEGKYCLFSDVDLSVPIEQIYKFLPPFSNSDISIASREMPGARRFDEPWNRHLMSRVFNFLVKFLVLPNIRDTQCGFKCFKKEVAKDIFRFQTLYRWSFDVEILFIAKLRRYSIAEIPVSWFYQQNSKVNPIQDSMRMLSDILTIRRNEKMGKYRQN